MRPDKVILIREGNSKRTYFAKHFVWMNDIVGDGIVDLNFLAYFKRTTIDLTVYLNVSFFAAQVTLHTPITVIQACYVVVAIWLNEVLVRVVSYFPATGP
ncbi:hypothetical protein DGG96_14475 [Legionella qingyii]|uniref:Uncharacterized protein n=1 Tax=Legionella qingyii TaxID=2184757 RepID=A0A317TZ17_9GAMM|nr:hypothetical protein DGG96_14475 [Legionella qingyii]